MGHGHAWKFHTWLLHIVQTGVSVWQGCELNCNHAVDAFIWYVLRVQTPIARQCPTSCVIPGLTFGCQVPLWCQFSQKMSAVWMAKGPGNSLVMLSSQKIITTPKYIQGRLANQNYRVQLHGKFGQSKFALKQTSCILYTNVLWLSHQCVLCFITMYVKKFLSQRTGKRAQTSRWKSIWAGLREKVRKVMARKFEKRAIKHWSCCCFRLILRYKNDHRSATEQYFFKLFHQRFSFFFFFFAWTGLRNDQNPIFKFLTFVLYLLALLPRFKLWRRQDDFFTVCFERSHSAWSGNIFSCSTPNFVFLWEVLLDQTEKKDINWQKVAFLFVLFVSKIHQVHEKNLKKNLACAVSLFSPDPAGSVSSSIFFSENERIWWIWTRASFEKKANMSQARQNNNYFVNCHKKCLRANFQPSPP